MTIRTYPSPEAFKQALEQRLRTAIGSGAGLSRKRQLLIFDRFLARVAATFGDAATLKGGLVLELRLARARTTKDVDLRLVGAPEDILAKLAQAGRRDLGDFMTFEVAPDEEHPEIQNDGMPYDGLRFRAECKLAGRLYGHRFGVDVVFGDPIFGEPEERIAEDVLAFAGIPPPKLRVYPIETHIAEKLHAYTMPRPYPNSRVKDLPDLALLATAQPLEATRLRAALEQTFAFRKTHPLPAKVPDPLPAWANSYAAMAREDQLAWPTLADVASAVQAFLDPILVEAMDATWDPDGWRWRSIALGEAALC
jgi:predicted nucleotidyltransferase component of viral defense system